MEEFIQTPPALGNQFTEDELLISYLKFRLPEKMFDEVFLTLSRFGERVVKDILYHARDAEEHPPVHIAFDAWGNRVDQIKTSTGWRELHRISAEEEIVSLGYSRRYREYSRSVQFAKLYLFHPSSAFYSCPLAMTDGAAKLIEIYGDEELKRNAFMHLVSSHPETFWISGQWMTERSGGSDVSGCETIAKEENGQWRLYGTKWFCSAVDAQMCMLLARIEGDHGESERRGPGLSLFYVELFKSEDKRHYEILRLKDKLGTKALPTAEVKLKGIKAKLVGVPGEGVKQIASMFNITRLYNAVTSVAAFRRILCLAQDYATKRKAFGKNIIDQPLISLLLASAHQDFRKCFHLTFLISELAGLEERFEELNQFQLDFDQIKKLLRLLTPVVKLYTAKLVVSWSSELLEVFGGAGYIEDTGIPQLVRDNQVFSLWEGTTNVMALDLLRAIKKDQSFSVFVMMFRKKCKSYEAGEFKAEVRILTSALEQLGEIEKDSEEKSVAEQEAQAREIAFSIGNLAALVHMLEYVSSADCDQKAKLLFKLCLEKNPVHVEAMDFDSLEKRSRLFR
jgi:alkylation response protein AidB-like acyl-CoA dehydrogenase